MVGSSLSKGAELCKILRDIGGFQQGIWFVTRGIHLAVVIDKMVTDVEWLSVHKVTRVKGKLKIKYVRHELYEEYIMFHQKVHQEIPINELSVAITRVFTTRIVHLQRK